MEKCCRNCKYFEYGKCVNINELFTIRFEGTVEDEEYNEIVFSEEDADVDDIDLYINNPESFYCKEWE